MFLGGMITGTMNGHNKMREWDRKPHNAYGFGPRLDENEMQRDVGLWSLMKSNAWKEAATTGFAAGAAGTGAALLAHRALHGRPQPPPGPPPDREAWVDPQNPHVIHFPRP